MTIASIQFQDAAATQAKALGLDDARCTFVAHPIQDANDDEMRQKADKIIDGVIKALTEN